jgi:N6-adenosine-specific RNA methylase IME4
LTELVRYEAARKALAEAVAVDEVMQIRNQADAMRHAARIARDRDLEIQAAQIRFRAERRLGELIRAQKETVGLAQGRRTDLVPNGNEVADGKVTLAEAGIDRKVSMRAQRVAALPVEKFETLLDQHAAEMRAGAGRVAMDLLRVNADQDGREHRRNLQVTLSDAAAALPSGRKYPVIYADPPWHRKQGVTSRSYENHYPTMSWSDICALPVKDLLLPDAWLFLWIPRAHAFALHEIETEVTGVETGEVIRAKVKMPLAWAVAQAWGFDAYSTAFVWTKTDEDHPDEAGGAVLVRDQDELLLMFKRGCGNAKPDTGEKFGSNHRERSRPLGHSTKPQHYRRMIATMAGRGVPVLEMFARFDADNPPLPGWDLWGNQAAASDDSSRNADGGEGQPVVDQPAPPAVGILPDDGKVDSVASMPSACAVAAVPPADRPGSNSQATEAHPLDIPEFLRRAPKQAEMDLTRRDRSPPEIVDGVLQARLPLTEDELTLHVALTSIVAGEAVASWILRDLEGAGFVHIGTSSVKVTDEGRAFLAQLVPPAAPAIEARA